MTRAGLLLLGALLTAGFLLYLPGVGGPYIADDFPNLASNHLLLIESPSLDAIRDAAFSSRSSPWYRPLAMLTFALSYSLAGNLEPFSAKFWNVLLHLAGGVLVYLLALRLLPGLRTFGTRPRGERDAENVALLAAAFWLLHPLFVSTVLYTVQRMSILSALFTLGGCLFYLQRRPRLGGMRDVVTLAAGIGVFTLFGFLCKETGALLPGFLLLIEATLFRFRYEGNPGQGVRVLLPVILCLPVAAVLLYLAGSYLQHWDQATAHHGATVHQRFLTQFRVLLHYAGWLTLLNPRPLGLWHDDFVLSRSLLEPPATLLALLFWAGAAIAAVALARRRFVLGFGLLWFLWGHVIESTVIPIAPVFEHRNYLPGFGLVLALAALLHEAVQQMRLGPFAKPALLAVVLVLLPAWQLDERVAVWSDKGAFVERSLRDHPESLHTLVTVAAFLNSHGNAPAAVQALREAQRLDPADAAPAFAEAAVHCEHHPGERFDAELAARLHGPGMKAPRSATARMHFVYMARFCAPSAVNDEVLLPLYERHRASADENMAVASLFGAWAVYLRMGRMNDARTAWQKAINDYPQGAAIRNWVRVITPAG